MKVTEFSEKTKVDHVKAPWEDELGKDDFVSYMPSYVGGLYRDLFEECKLPSDAVGEMTYYLYNPMKNGDYGEEGRYPLLIFIHGATNALDGRICVSHCGGEMFASPDYQKTMDGAFVLVPLANERRDEEGNLADSWSEAYFEPLRDIIETVKEKYEKNIGKTVILGGSSGGGVSFAMAEHYPELFNGCVPVSAGYIPKDEVLDRLDNTGIQFLIMHGRHDELVPFEEVIAPREEKLLSMKHAICYFPEWVRNGDHGVASLYFGIEMGQHCVITQLQANMLYTDKTPYIPQLQEGITGWIRDL
ncbi:MAG: alpha/beta fold hydrolase [Lachnospiraceae bacterium]